MKAGRHGDCPASDAGEVTVQRRVIGRLRDRVMKGEVVFPASQEPAGMPYSILLLAVRMGPVNLGFDCARQK